MTESFRFSKNSPNWTIFGNFYWTFVHSKCKRSSLRSPCWMILFMWFSNTVLWLWNVCIMQFTTLIGDLQVTSAARETTFGTEGYHHHHHQHQFNNPNHFKATPVSFVYKSKEHVRSLFFNKVLTTKVVCTSYFFPTTGLSSSKIRRYIEA